MERKAFFIPFLHAHFHFLGHERLADRSVTKGYHKSDAAPWVEKRSPSIVFHAHDIWLYWSSENPLLEHFIACLNGKLHLTALLWKHARLLNIFEYESSFMIAKLTKTVLRDLCSGLWALMWKAKVQILLPGIPFFIKIKSESESDTSPHPTWRELG